MKSDEISSRVTEAYIPRVNLLRRLRMSFEKEDLSESPEARLSAYLNLRACVMSTFGKYEHMQEPSGPDGNDRRLTLKINNKYGSIVFLDRHPNKTCTILYLTVKTEDEGDTIKHERAYAGIELNHKGESLIKERMIVTDWESRAAYDGDANYGYGMPAEHVMREPNIILSAAEALSLKVELDSAEPVRMHDYNHFLPLDNQ